MLNLYRPPLGVTAQDELHEHTPAAEYDINFCFPVAEELKSPDGGVVLTPLIVSPAGQ